MPPQATRNIACSEIMFSAERYYVTFVLWQEPFVRLSFVTLFLLRQRLVLFGNIFARPNSSGTRTVFIKILGKNSKGFYGIVQVKYKGVWKIGVFRPISRFNSKTVQDTTIVSYTGRPSINCRQFCCYLYLVGLGWIHIFRFAMGWVGLGHSVDGLGWVGSGHRKWTHEQPWNKFTSEHLSYDSFGQVGVINVLNKENIRRIKITIKRFIQKNK